MATWTDEMDRRLLAGVTAGRSRGQMAKELGVPRCAAIARYNRLIGVVFPSDREIRRKRKQASALRATARRAVQSQILSSLELDLRLMERNHAIRKAVQLGADVAAVADVVGLTPARIYQIVQS